MIVEEQGGPLGVSVAGANLNDHKLLDATIAAIVVARPDPHEVEQHLCLDKGYDNQMSHEIVKKHGDIGHIRPVGEDRRGKRRPGRRKPRRWVVERTIGWWNRCRAILVRYDKKARNYLGLLQFACSLY